MSFDIKKMATDRAAETVGTWTEDLGNGLRLKVAREGNVKYNEAMRSAIKKRVGVAGMGDLPPEVAEDIVYEVFAQCVLLDWEGLSEDGQDLPYSQEVAARLLKDYPDFFRLVQGQARRVELFRAAKTEEARGN